MGFWVESFKDGSRYNLYVGFSVKLSERVANGAFMIGYNRNQKEFSCEDKLKNPFLVLLSTFLSESVNCDITSKI